jgi:mannosyltransferase OCH1-like enzyme
MPQLAKDCIASWHRHMPDWHYKLWNEDNFDVDSVPYTKEAYAARKYAFVTDYVRLYALSTEGGVYMDTDVEILKPLDDLLHLSAFTGYEGSKHKPPVTGLMASEAGGQWVEEQLHAYDGAHFRRSDGTLDTTTNTQRISAIMKANGFVCD